jgi:cation-transporting P-type ATPase 13A2
MEEDDSAVAESRRSSFVGNARRRSGLYRRGSNMSEASFITDVEMAQDEVRAPCVLKVVPH